MKKFILTHVSLSDSDLKLNGYSKVFFFNTIEDARNEMKSLAEDERLFCEDEGREYEILEDTKDEFRISWNGDGDQVRIQIYKVEI